MAVDTEIVARKYLEPVAGTPISVDIPATEESTISVLLGDVGDLAIQDTDYTISLNTSTYEDFTITPTASLRAKLDALIAEGSSDTIVVRRTLTYLSDMTAELALFRQKIATEFDKTIMRFQQLAEAVSRSLKLADVDIGSEASIPALSTLEGKYLAVSSGNIIGADGTTDTPISSTMSAFVGSSSLADARTELSVYSKAEADAAYDAAGDAAAALASAQAYADAQVVPLYGKNRVINGSMLLDLRSVGAAKTYTAGAAKAYGVDRFFAYCTGANVTGQRTANGGGFAYTLTGAASVTAIGFGTRLRASDTADLAGTTATLSVKLSNSLLTTVTWSAYYANTKDTFGSLASPTKTLIASGTFGVSSTLSRYSTQIAIPSAATTGIEIIFSVGAQTSGTWAITEVQLESGDRATAFERVKESDIIEACHPFCRKSYNLDVAPGTATVVGAVHWELNYLGTGPHTLTRDHTFGGRMRAPPTITLYSINTGASAKIYDYVAAADTTGTVSASGESGFIWSATGGSSTAVKMSFQYLAESEL